MFASLPGYYYGTSKEGLYVHLYNENRMNWKLEDGTALKLEMAAKYPWEGVVEMTVTPAPAREFTIFPRIPGWSAATKVSVNGKPVAGTVKAGEYLAVKRTWTAGDQLRLEFDMTPQAVVSHPLVKDNQGRVAIQRGPLVYLLEQAGQAAGVDVLESGYRLTGNMAKDFVAEFKPDLLDGVVVLKHRGYASAKPAAGLPLYRKIDFSEARSGAAAGLVLTPYYTFQNRGPSAMQVWVAYQR
jgi:hypothetical protein